MIKDNALLIWALCVLIVAVYLYIHPSWVEMLSEGGWIQ